MARAFRIYAKGQEKEVIEFIEAHTINETEKKFGYRWTTIKPWYDEHKKTDPLSFGEPNVYGGSTVAEKIVSALFTKYDKLQGEIIRLETQLKQAKGQLAYLEEIKKSKERIDWGSFREVYEYCKNEA